MKPVSSNPLFLLIGTGAGLAMITPLAQLALEAGINPFFWAAMIALCQVSASGGLQPGKGRSGKAPHSGSMACWAALLANLIPSSILLFAIPHIGSGLAGLMFALSPVVTAVLSLLLRVRPPNAPAAGGGGAGLCGGSDRGHGPQCPCLALSTTMAADCAAGAVLVGHRQCLPHRQMARRCHAAANCRRRQPVCRASACFAWPSGMAAAGGHCSSNPGWFWHNGLAALLNVAPVLPPAMDQRPNLPEPDRLCRCRHQPCHWHAVFWANPTRWPSGSVLL